MIFATEIEILKRIDLIVLSQPSYSDYFEELGGIVALSNAQVVGFRAYITNYILYTLVESQTRSNTHFNCLVACLFFFQLHNNVRGLSAVISIFKISYKVNSPFLRRFKFLVKNIEKELSALGNNPDTIRSVADKILEQPCFGLLTRNNWLK